VSPLEPLDWDSRFFGVPIARVLASGPEDVGAAREEAERSGIQCLYLLVPVDDLATCSAAENVGFRLVDVRVELGKSLNRGDAAATGVRQERSGDLPALEHLARERFEQTRFYADPRFPRDRVAELYVAWLHRGLADGSARTVLVADDGDGFVLCHVGDGSGTIELIAVDDDSEGRGIASTLVRGADAWFASAGMTKARVATQARNIAAQRLYQRHGYRTEAVGIWLHWWAPGKPTS
jgi:dTDP-4-amino-4,6-dideoxy-D-galactose acyltransferase